MKSDERAKARLLRHEGKSIKFIARTLDVSPSSVSRWVNDIPCVVAIAPRKKWSQERRNSVDEKRNSYREKGWIRAKSDEAFRIICALYWGEGTKNKSVRLTNADSKMIAIFAKWLTSENWNYSTRIQYHTTNGLTVEEIKSWWIVNAGLLPSSFKEFRASKFGNPKKIGKLPYGTVSIEVNRIELLYQIYGGMDYLKTGMWLSG